MGLVEHLRRQNQAVVRVRSRNGKRVRHQRLLRTQFTDRANRLRRRLWTKPRHNTSEFESVRAFSRCVTVVWMCKGVSQNSLIIKRISLDLFSWFRKSSSPIPKALQRKPSQILARLVTHQLASSARRSGAPAGACAQRHPFRMSAGHRHPVYRKNGSYVVACLCVR